MSNYGGQNFDITKEKLDEKHQDAHLGPNRTVMICCLLLFYT